MSTLREFVGATLQDAAHGALSEAQRAEPPFDIVMLEGDVSDCGLVPPAFRFASGECFGDEGNWRSLRQLLSVKKPRHEQRGEPRILVISTAAADAVASRRVVDDDRAHVWRLQQVDPRSEMRGVARFSEPRASPKLSSKTWKWAALHASVPSSGAGEREREGAPQRSAHQC